MSTIKLWVFGNIIRVLPESRAFSLKAALLRWAGAKVGAHVRIYSSVTILGNGMLEIGDDVHIGSRVVLYAVAPAVIKIGSQVDIGPDVMILTGSHRIDTSGEHIAGEGVAESVFVGRGSWLGARTTLLAGVSLHAKTITAAGAVVTQSTRAERTLLAGMPAEVKRSYD